MDLALENALSARKTPVQERSAATVDAIAEATVQVLLQMGAERITTTRVAARAGVSVGTLYQYYPNKQALLFAVLEHHMIRLAEAVERTCAERHGRPVAEMVDGLVDTYVTAKLERADISLALYQISSALDGPALVARATARGRAAIEAMLRTAPEAEFDDLPFTTMMVFAALAGATRAVLESGAPLGMVAMLRKELVVLCGRYLGCSAQDRPR